jgi:hypothetical protein
MQFPYKAGHVKFKLNGDNTTQANYQRRTE